MLSLLGTWDRHWFIHPLLYRGGVSATLASMNAIQKLLGLETIKEAILYPRDVKRLTP